MSFILRPKGIGKGVPTIAEAAGMTTVTSGEDSIPSTGKYCFRWGCVGAIPSDFSVVNSVKAQEKSGDKRMFRKALSELNLCPPSWTSLQDMLSSLSDWPKGELLVRPATHSRSKDMFLSTGPSGLAESISKVGPSYYISEFVKKKQEFRVFVCQGRVAWVIEKHPKSADDISWGCVSDGTFDYVDWSSWPEAVIHNALASMKVSGLDFGAVDLTVTEAGEVYTFEINCAPFLTPYYGKTIAKCFKYIEENGKEHFPDLSTYGWKESIHPAIKSF